MVAFIGSKKGANSSVLGEGATLSKPRGYAGALGLDLWAGWWCHTQTVAYVTGIDRHPSKLHDHHLAYRTPLPVPQVPIDGTIPSGGRSCA
jgi:hypothetical protein